MTDEQRSNKDIFLQAMEILNSLAAGRGEQDLLDEVFDDDVVVDWPQSRERTRGLESFKAVGRNYRNIQISDRRVVGEDQGRYLLTPMFTTVKVEGTGDTVVASAKIKYPDGSDWYVINLATMRNGKIVKLVQYFAPFLEAPEWRSQWVERMEDDN